MPFPADPPAKRRPGRPWGSTRTATAARDKRLIAYFLAGHILSETARHFGISPSSAHRVLKLARDVP